MLSYLYSLPLAALLWLLHFLPLTLLAPIGRGIGHLLYLFASRRRKIAALNIDWCFPELDQKSARPSSTPISRLWAEASSSVPFSGGPAPSVYAA